jgi:hypothetical protein
VLANILAQYASVAPSTGPLVRQTPGDVVICNVIQDGVGGRVADGWIVGAGPGTLIYQLAVDSIAPKTPGYLGTTLPLTTAQATLSPLSQKGAVRQLIFTDVAPGPSNTDTFNVWADLMAYKQLIDVPLHICFQQSDPNTPLHIPAGLWVMGDGVTWVSQGVVNGGAEVFLDDGCVIHDLRVIDRGLAVVGNSTAPSLTFSPPAIPGNPVILALNSPMANAGASPMIVQASPDLLIIGMLEGAALASFGPTPIVDVAAASTLAFYMFGGEIQNNTLSGAPGAIVLFQVTNDTVIVGLSQPAWAGLPLATTAFTVQQRPRVNIQTPPLPSGATYNAVNGSEFVRAAPTGAGDISIVLIPASLCPDETALVKKTTTDVVDNINITTSDGSLIDGLALYTMPLAALCAARFVSDGVGYWVTG